MITVCQNTTLDSSEILGVDLGSSPFLFSKSHNRFVFEGCGYAVMMHNYMSVISTCLTNCINDTVSDRNDTLSDTNNCIGFSCCQTTIPHHLKSYNVRLRILESKVEAKACGSAFLVDIALFDLKRFPDPFVVKNTSFIPVSLVWTLASSDQITCCNNRTRIIRKVDVFDSTPVDTWLCDASRGTPYLVDGCDDHGIVYMLFNFVVCYSTSSPFSGIEKCLRKSVRCEDRGGFCDQDTTYYIDGSVFSHNTTCNYYDDNRKSSKTSLGVILGDAYSLCFYSIYISIYIWQAVKLHIRNKSLKLLDWTYNIIKFISN
ncbi:putative wall-associated receptor kinase [Helianthus anomalus]